MACVVKREPFLLAVGMVYLFKSIYIYNNVADYFHKQSAT